MEAGIRGQSIMNPKFHDVQDIDSRKTNYPNCGMGKKN